MTVTRGRGRPRDPDTDAAIVRAAREEFVEHGIEAASLERIARRAGVTKPTIYRRWATKEQLIAHAIEDSVRADLSAPIPADLSTHEIIERALPAAAQMVASPDFRALVARVMGTAVSHPELMAVYWEHYILPRREQAAALLARNGITEDVDVLIDMMAGAVTWRVLQPDPPDAAEMLRFLKVVYRQVGLYQREVT